MSKYISMQNNTQLLPIHCFRTSIILYVWLSVFLHKLTFKGAATLQITVSVLPPSSPYIIKALSQLVLYTTYHFRHYIREETFGKIYVRSSSSNIEYITKLPEKFSEEMPSCTCPDWESTYLPCKHMFAIFQFLPRYDCSSLPSTF